MSNQAKVRAIYTLLGEHHLRDEKENIVSSFTSGKTTSVRAMSDAQAAALIGHLKSLDQTDNRATKMRNKILSMSHEMGWHLTPALSKGEGGIQVKSKVDIDRVNNWCKKYGYLHKAIDDYSYNELPRLVSQFEGVYKDSLKKV